ncbi:MAG: 16S rRNA (guanine(527)-N(7))-methyltransferase RsmG [Pseudomonadota bacterium]
MTGGRGLLPKSMGVSRETEARLGAFLDRVALWTVKINLVSRGTIADLHARHLLDSAQLLDHARSSDRIWADLGSGGGFPAIVIAIIARDIRPDIRFTLVESDKRKATFLRMIVAEQRLSATVVAARIESVPPLKADVVSARALAPLDRLLGMAERHLATDGIALFPKGETYRAEIATARKTWHFDVEDTPSVTRDAAALLKIKDIRRA